MQIKSDVSWVKQEVYLLLSANVFETKEQCLAAEPRQVRDLNGIVLKKSSISGFLSL